MKKQKWQGALVATAVVVLGSLTGINAGWPIVLTLGPVLAFFCVILGSILTIFERTRVFAVGFLITSAILIFVTAGVCVAALSGGLA